MRGVLQFNRLETAVYEILVPHKPAGVRAAMDYFTTAAKGGTG